MTSRTGNIFTVVAPSGAGKTTLVNALLAADPEVQLSVSYTTRAPRAGEIEGKSYHFVSEGTFREMIARNELLEYAEVHGNFYATSRIWIERALQNGRDILLEIDWQGAQQVKQAFADMIGIFILPPSIKALKKRLLGRGTDNPDVIERRFLAAKAEIDHLDEFDYVIINEDLAEAVQDLIAIVRAARLTRARQQWRIQPVLAQNT